MLKKFKRNTVLREVVPATFEVLLGIASLFEPAMLLVRDRSAVERYRAYEKSRAYWRERRKDQKRLFNAQVKQNAKYSKALYHLERASYLIEDKKTKQLQLTQKGWLKLARVQLQRYALLTKEVKGNENKHLQHYLIMFDVPEQYRRVRDLLRRCLCGGGFSQLQKSIFLTQDKKAYRFARAVIERSKIKEYVKYIEAQSIE